MKCSNVIQYISAKNEIYIYGDGAVAKHLAQTLQHQNIEYKGHVVSDGYLKERVCLGKTVEELSKIKITSETGIVVAVHSVYIKEVLEKLKNRGVEDYYILGDVYKISRWKLKKDKTIKREMNCPYCTTKAKILLKGKDYNSFFSNPVIREWNETFYLYECAGCGLQFIGNVPSDLSFYYPESYYGVVTAQVIKENAEYNKVDIVRKFKENGKLLEIGPGMGTFCYAAKESGYEVSAIEMDERAVEFLNSQLEIAAIKSNEPEKILEKYGATYDVICLWHSLEHMKNPWVVLDACKFALKKGGVLLIAVPNPNSFLAKVMGRYWAHYDLPRHLFGIPERWLKGYCEKNDMLLESCIYGTEVNDFWNQFAWGKLFELVSGGKTVAYERGLKVKIFKKYEMLPGNGSTYIAILRK